MVTMQVLSRAEAQSELRDLERQIRAAFGTTDRAQLRRLSMSSGTSVAMVRAIERVAELDFLLAG